MSDEDRVMRAMRAVERRVAAAAGASAPATKPDAPVRFGLNERTAPLMFAGTGIPADPVLDALGHSISLGSHSAAVLSFWLGYELARDGET